MTSKKRRFIRSIVACSMVLMMTATTFTPLGNVVDLGLSVTASAASTIFSKNLAVGNFIWSGDTVKYGEKGNVTVTFADESGNTIGTVTKKGNTTYTFTNDYQILSKNSRTYTMTLVTHHDAVASTCTSKGNQEYYSNKRKHLAIILGLKNRYFV